MGFGLRIRVVTGKRAEAIAVVKGAGGKNTQERNQMGRYVGAVYAGLGDKDKAFEMVGKRLSDPGGT